MFSGSGEKTCPVNYLIRACKSPKDKDKGICTTRAASIEYRVMERIYGLTTSDSVRRIANECRNGKRSMYGSWWQ